MQTTEKTQRVSKFLKLDFPTVNLREANNVIKFNVENLNKKALIDLVAISISSKCDVEVKRSGTGLVIIIKC